MTLPTSYMAGEAPSTTTGSLTDQVCCTGSRIRRADGTCEAPVIATVPFVRRNVNGYIGSRVVALLRIDQLSVAGSYRSGFSGLQLSHPLTPPTRSSAPSPRTVVDAYQVV